MPLQKQTVEVPLIGGLNTKTDPRALDIPFLSECKNAVFDEHGGIQKRFGYTAKATDILDSTTISSARKIVSYGDELLLFTATQLYSWSAASSKWVARGEHLAAHVTERDMFVRPTEQYDCDMAVLGGIAFYVWTDAGSSTVAYIAAADETTGAVVLSPTSLGAGTSRPRLVALGSYVMLFYVVAGVVQAKRLSPTSIATTLAVAATALTSSSAATYGYDVKKVDSTNAVVVSVAAAATYIVYKIADSMSFSSSAKARSTTGPVAIAYESGDGVLCVARVDSGNVVRGDIITYSSLADATVNVSLVTSIGTMGHLSCEYSDDGSFSVVVSDDESTDETGFETRLNSIDSAGTPGTESVIAKRMALASHVFEHNNETFAWLVFAGDSRVSAMTGNTKTQLQNTYYLYRISGTSGPTEKLVAKAATQVAGGFVASVGHLPGVQNTSGNIFSHCGTARRSITLGASQTDYADRGPRRVVVEFDSNKARRTAQIGDTLYISGGHVQQYDGRAIVEVGFHTYPWYFTMVVAATGALSAGDYAYKNTLRWDNAKGEQDRSTTATVGVTTTALNDQVTMDYANVVTTKKSNVAVEVWRTLVNPLDDSPFYLTTTKDPSDRAGDNHYNENDVTAYYDGGAWVDAMSDADLANKETSPENGGVLEPIAPPPASIIVATDERLFLAGISHAENQVMYSKYRGAAEVAAFNDALKVDLPADGGPITALALLAGTIIAFKESAIYALSGSGFDNIGGGANYVPQKLPCDVGAVSQESVAATPDGVVFKSSKGWYMLDRAFTCRYIGAPVADYDTDTVLAAHTLETVHQIRIMTSARVLMFDYLVGQWSEWEIVGLSATIHLGVYQYLGSNATTVYGENATWTGPAAYSLQVATPWIKLEGFQGFGRLYKAMLLGEYRASHRTRVQVAYNYLDTYVDDKKWTVSPTTVGGPLQVRHAPSRQRCEAIKIRISDLLTGADTPSTSESLKLTALSFLFGVKRGKMKLPSAQRQ